MKLIDYLDLLIKSRRITLLKTLIHSQKPVHRWNLIQTMKMNSNSLNQDLQDFVDEGIVIKKGKKVTIGEYKGKRVVDSFIINKENKIIQILMREI